MRWTHGSKNIAIALAATGSMLVGAIGHCAEPDFTMMRYGEEIGCGLYMQFFKADGSEALKDGKPVSDFYPAGAPPSTSPQACLAKCETWAASGMVKDMLTIFAHQLSVTRASGTCYLHGKALGPPRALAGP